MSSHKLLLATVLCAMSALSLAPGAAATAIRVDPGASLLASGSTVTGKGRSTIVASVGTGTCDASFDYDVGTNPATPTVAMTLTGFTLSGCRDTIPFIDFDDCSAVAPFPAVTATALAGGGTLTLTNTFVRCHVLGSGTPGTACYFKAQTASGAFANATSTLTYTSVATVHTVPPTNSGDQGALCASFAFTLSMDFTNVHAANGSRVTMTTS
jgi:hypothetical protein